MPLQPESEYDRRERERWEADRYRDRGAGPFWGQRSGSSAQPEWERRETGGELRVVSREGTPGAMLMGTAIVFDSLSEDLGGFRERISPGAMDRTVREKIDVLALMEHDSGKVLGRLSKQTLRMRVDPKGVHVEIDLGQTSYARDALESIGRGDVSGMSFRFRDLTPPQTAWQMEGEQAVRTVRDMIVREVSVVSMPAYPATEVDVARRSLDEAQREGWIIVPTKAYRPSLAMIKNRHRHAGAW